MGKTISYQRPDGQRVDGFIEEPAHGSAPGIVVIQEWWGLNDQIRGVASKLAAAGYRALVPDLYRGKIALDANEAEHLMYKIVDAVVKEHKRPSQTADVKRPGRYKSKNPNRGHFSKKNQPVHAMAASAGVNEDDA